MRKCIIVLLALTMLSSFSGIKNIWRNSRSKQAMSSTQLKIISTQPAYVPGKTQQDNAKILLQKFYGKQQVKFETTGNIEFVDQGTNFDSVSCNLCGRNIELEKWQDAMDNASKTKFVNLSFITPCCHKTTSLNDLRYTWPAGFAKFVIIIEDAQKEIPANDLQKLENIFNTKLRIIWAHY